MTELEILSNLKIAYRELEDIIENADNEQIEEEEYINLKYAMNILEEQYEKIYKRIEEENKQGLYYGKDLLIADQIYHDYVTKSEDYDDQYITYADMENEQKWWEDYNFLIK